MAPPEQPYMAPIPQSFTESGPTAVIFNDRLHVIYRGLNNQLVSQSTLDGQNWYEPVELDGTVNSSDQPGAFLYQNTPFVFYKGVPGDSGIYYTSYDGDSGTWVQATALPASINTSAGPTGFVGLNVVLNDLLQFITYVFYKEADDQGIYMITSADSLSTPHPTGWLTDVAPAAATENAAPFYDPHAIYQVYFKDPAPASTISMRMSDASMKNWISAALPPEVETSDAPGPILYGNTVNVFYKGAGSDQTIYMTSAAIGSPTTPASEISWAAPTPVPNCGTTSAGPKPISFLNNLFLIYKGPAGDNHLYFTVYSGAFQPPQNARGS